MERQVGEERSRAAESTQLRTVTATCQQHRFYPAQQIRRRGRSGKEFYGENSNASWILATCQKSFRGSTLANISHVGEDESTTLSTVTQTRTFVII